MPRSAARAVGRVDQLTVAGLAELTSAWAAGLGDDRPHDEDEHPQITKEVGMASMDPDAMHDLVRPGMPSGFGCPDCAGALFQLEEGNLVRYRCRVGHAWSADSLLARQAVDLEGALWVALRSLEEKAALNAKLGERANGQGHDRTAARFNENVQEALGAAELVRQLITTIGGPTEPADESGQTVSG
jgi:two-component system, chemotaxis family, protein-glutamate methylesterase/glutaminase